MSISLSKKKGFPVFTVKSGRDKGKKFKINLDHKSEDGDQLRSYNKGTLQIIPNGKTRECHLVCGPSGSGKSYWAANYIKEYKRKFPKNPVYLVSPKPEDDALDELNVFRLKLNEKNWIDDPPDLEEFEDSLVVFDDCEAIGDKNIALAVNKFKDQILLQGRSKNISIIVISHILMDYRNTRVQLSESHTLTFFPSAGSQYHLKQFMQVHCGLSRNQVEDILKMPSRHVTLHKCYPNWILSSNEFKFL